MESSPKLVVRNVWSHNLYDELVLIDRSLAEFTFVSMDTEFPGTVFQPTHVPKHLLSSLPAPELYFMMKTNVNSLNLIQLGLTLFDADGNLPSLDSDESHYVWQFNFRDFDRDHDLQNPDSISLLERQGIDFSKNRIDGVDSSDFADLFQACIRGRNLTWITFHGIYDYGFLIKILIGTELPHRYNEFMMLMEYYLGSAVHDVKPMAKELGLLGGLERIATTLNLDRVGNSHQAGSDSLLTMQVFMKLMIHVSAMRMNSPLFVRYPCISPPLLLPYPCIVHNMFRV